MIASPAADRGRGRGTGQGQGQGIGQGQDGQVVTAAMFLVEDGELAGATVGALLTLSGAEARHAVTVRRVRVGEAVDLADGSGAVARCLVTAAGRERLEVRVRGWDVGPEPARRLVLVQALAKGGRDEQAVETATEIGVDAVVPWQAARSVVIWAGERGQRSRQRWVATARAAAKQSRRARVPRVLELVDLPGLVALGDRAAAVLVLHEDATDPLSATALPTAGDVLLVVGPEGGIDPAELAALGAAGGRPVRLGPQVLRSSTAGAAAAVVLAVRTGRW